MTKDLVCCEILIFILIFVLWCPFMQYGPHIFLGTPTLDADI